MKNRLLMPFLAITCSLSLSTTLITPSNAQNRDEEHLWANSAPAEGSYLGQGRANQSVFRGGRRANATLDYNRNRGFSFRVAVPPGTGAQVNYIGRINTITGTNPRNPSSFVLQGRIRSFASSANNLRVIQTTGQCRIEVADSRIVSANCNANARGGNTSFVGISQF